MGKLYTEFFQDSGNPEAESVGMGGLCLSIGLALTGFSVSEKHHESAT